MKYLPIIAAIVFGCGLIGFALYLTKSPWCLCGLFGVWIVCIEAKPETEYYDGVDDEKETVNEN